MNNSTAKTTRTFCIIAGIASVICFFLPFVKVSLLSESESYSGIGVIIELLGKNNMDANDKTIFWWTVGALAMTVIGAFANLKKSGSIGGAIIDAIGVVCLYCLKNELSSYGIVNKLVKTDVGWTFALLALIIAAVMSLATVFLGGKATVSAAPTYPAPGADPAAPAEPPKKDIDPDALLKLKDDLAKFRGYDDSKK